MRIKRLNREGYVLILLSLIITWAIWFGSKAYFTDWFSDPYKYVAKTASLGATILVCWSLILSARYPLIEDLFGGLDKVYRAHRLVGKASFYLILLHPLFLSFQRLPDVLEWIRFFGLRDWNYSNYFLGHNLGLAAFFLMLGLIATTLWIKMPYERWKSLHSWFGAFVVLVAVHIVLVGANAARYPWLGLWLQVWIWVSLVSFLVYNFSYKFWGRRFDYRVDSIEHVDKGVELWLEPAGRALPFIPGQFAFFNFQNSSLPSESHPFSMACAPNREGKIKLGIRNLGDFTGRIGSLEPGDRVLIQGPHGRFSRYFLYGNRDCVFIGAGIGITPFLGMWDMALNSDERVSVVFDSESPELHKKHGPINFEPEGVKLWQSPRVHFFYLCRNKEEASFLNDIEQIGIISQYNGFAPYQLRGHYFELHQSEKQGLFDIQSIKTKVKNYREQYYFICGPAAMKKSITAQLRKDGVPAYRIFSEDFNFRGQ